MSVEQLAVGAGLTLLGSVTAGGIAFLLQGQQLRSDRKSRSQDAIRAMRREYLVPVFALLAEMSTLAVYRIGMDAISAPEVADLVQDAMKDLPADYHEQVRAAVVAAATKGITPTDEWPTLGLRGMALSAHISDLELRIDFMRFAIEVLDTHIDETMRLRQIGDLYARLYAYASEVDEPPKSKEERESAVRK
jgi:hypothetical protein